MFSPPCVFAAAEGHCMSLIIHQPSVCPSPASGGDSHPAGTGQQKFNSFVFDASPV